MNGNFTSISDGNSGGLQRRRALTGILEYAIASLELTKEQRESAEEEYTDCGEHLAECLKEHESETFPQGSMRLGTVIRPYRDITDLFDLDLVFWLGPFGSECGPKWLRETVGTELRKKYNGSVKPLAKGWRLDFSASREYHLDVIPAIQSARGGEVLSIPDGLKWKDTNPRGYARWFELKASIQARFEAEPEMKAASTTLFNAKIEPLPEHTQFKSVLHRIVQMSKRHRDYFFNKLKKVPDFATASIVVTTLLSKAYGCLARARTYESGFDLLLACVADMPHHLEILSDSQGRRLYRLENPSLLDENLVERWNSDSSGKWFFEWHREYVSFLEQLIGQRFDQRLLLTETLGIKPVNEAFAKQSESISAARSLKLLSVSPTVGLTISPGISVPRHVLHGLK